jgi:hypothetical protein
MLKGAIHPLKDDYSSSIGSKNSMQLQGTAGATASFSF